MQLINKFNRGFRFLLCVIDMFSKYGWVIPLNHKNGIPITNAFQKNFKESNRKLNKIWVDKSRKSVVTERFIRTLKNKVYKYMTSVSKNIYINKLDDIVHIYNNTYDSTIKIKPVDVKSSTYIASSKEIKYQDPKFKVRDTVRTSKHKNIFAKRYVPNWSEEVFFD